MAALTVVNRVAGGVSACRGSAYLYGSKLQPNSAAWSVRQYGKLIASGRRRPCTNRRYSTVRASNADMGAGAGNLGSSKDTSGAAGPGELIQPDGSGNVKLAQLLGTGAVIATIAAGALTYASGGPAAVVAAIAKSGFTAAFSLVFVSEIGDKTFFIAALLAMRHSKVPVFLGAMSALGLMTIISVAIGRLFQKVPAQLQTTLPIGEYAAVALLVYFGFRCLKNAWDLPSEPAFAKGAEEEAGGEFKEAEELVNQSKKISTPWEVIVESFSLIFAAEWGDRSMLATIALGATQSPAGVATGAIVGHGVATAIAILGGSFLSAHISEKMVGYAGGILFLVFAAATLLGVF